MEHIIIIGGISAGLISTLCWNIRRSRCESIDTPCISCKRNLMNAKEMRADKAPVNQFDGVVSREDSYVTAPNCQSPHGPSPLSITLARLKSNDNAN